MRHIFPPQDLLPQGVLYGHQAEAPAPIGRVHLDDDLLVPGHLPDIAHTFEVTPYGLGGHPVLPGKLLARLLALDVIRYHLGLVAAFTASELLPAVLAFVHLYAAS